MTAGLLLDTHTWIWLVLGLELKPKAVKTMTQAAENGQLYLSAISVWELGMLESKGRIQLSEDVTQWSKKALSISGLNSVDLLPEIALASSRLPGEFHGDPADCILVATARHLQVPIATRDNKILSYSKMGHLKVIKI